MKVLVVDAETEPEFLPTGVSFKKGICLSGKLVVNFPCSQFGVWVSCSGFIRACLLQLPAARLSEWAIKSKQGAGTD